MYIYFPVYTDCCVASKYGREIRPEKGVLLAVGAVAAAAAAFRAHVVASAAWSCEL